jgi:hypothetical protein
VAMIHKIVLLVWLQQDGEEAATILPAHSLLRLLKIPRARVHQGLGDTLQGKAGNQSRLGPTPPQDVSRLEQKALPQSSVHVEACLTFGVSNRPSR